MTLLKELWVEVYEEDTSKKGKKKQKKDKGADKFYQHVVGNMIHHNTCSGKLSGDKTLSENRQFLLSRIPQHLKNMSQLIVEAKRPTKTRTAGEVDLDSIFGSPRKVNPLAPSGEPQSPDVSRSPELKRAGRSATQRAAAGVRLDPRSQELLGNLEASGLQDDREVRPRRPGTELARQSRDLATRSTDISTEQGEPSWHKIEDLPGYMKSAIRAMGRQIFSPLTNTDIEDIDVIANLGGSGPNADEELRVVGSYLRRNGTRDVQAEMDFNQTVLRGYKADIQLWKAGGREYLTVKDHAGHYIYSWPEEDSKSFNLMRPRLK